MDTTQGTTFDTPTPATAASAPMSTAAPTPASGRPAALSLLGLGKSFGTVQAVHDLVLEVPAGSFCGLVGPNGAGKSTTLSMATGLLRPDTGRALIEGIDVWADPVAVKARIGVLPEGLRIFERLSGSELLHYNGGLRGMAPATVHERSQALLEVLGLTSAADKLVADYSTGMRKKIGLACALLHNPSVLFLDEPLEGVDPVSAETVSEVLRRYVASGSTVILSSHVMELVERLCSWVAVMSAGQVVAAGPLDEVRDGTSLHDRFLALVGGAPVDESSLGWLGGQRS